MGDVMKKYLVLIFVIFSFCLLTGCGKEKNESIIGTWYYYSNNKENTEIYYVFNEDKTGSHTLTDNSINFTYELNESQIVIKYVDIDTEGTLDYKIDDDILTIKDSFGDDVTYKLKRDNN